MFELFNPADGIAVYTVPFAWVARLIVRFTNLDWARKGEGWTR